MKNFIVKTKKINIENFCAIIFIVTVLLNNSYFFQIQEVYYGMIIFLWIVLMLKSIPEKIFLSKMMWFYLFCYLSILINDIPVHYNSYSKLSIFIISSSLLGPFLKTTSLKRFRLAIFNKRMLVNLWICSFSFIFKVVGLHNGYVYNEAVDNFRPDFAGLYNHSMVLGPMSGIGILFCIYKYYDKFLIKDRLFYIICLFLCLMSLSNTGSRSAIVGLLAGFIFLIYKIKRGSLSKVFVICFVVISLLILTFPLYKDSTSFLFEKFSDYKNQDASLTRSRNDLWMNRINEFRDHPLFGVGFGSARYGDNDLDGNFEPGSSWLVILSTTGTFGLLFFFLGYFYFFLRKLRGFSLSKKDYFVLSICLHLSFYMIFEGVVLSAGTLMYCVIWLVFGWCMLIDFPKKSMNLSK